VRVSFSITGDHELSDPTSNHCERIQEQGFAQFKAPWGCNLFTFALIGVFYRPILASMFALNLQSAARPAVAPYQLGARAIKMQASNHTMNKPRGSEVESPDFLFL